MPVDDDHNAVIVFDTNVLLADPQALFAYPHAQIIIPETVLSELDKLKTAHVDPDIRFRGRQVTRQIFELADGNSLIEGVGLPEGGTLRVIPFEYNNRALPDGFATRSPDDKILATTWLVSEELNDGEELTLMTNDLNMLLKAQTLGIAVSQFGKGDSVSFGRRFIIRPAQRYRVPLTILALAVALFAAVVIIAVYTGGFSRARSVTISTEFRNLLTTSQQSAYDALVSLQSNPDDADAMLTLGNFYSDRASMDQANGDSASMMTDAKNGIKYYTSYLAHYPTAGDARSDMAMLYYYSGNTDRAIQEVGQVLKLTPNHILANYYLGVYYAFGQSRLDDASKQMEKVISLTKDDSAQKTIYDQATLMLQQIKSRQQSTTTSATTS